jgi:antitoxin ParD1/3/4
MATMNISLPEVMREWIEQRIAEGGYGTASEYFRELIRVDQKRRAEEQLEALLLEGLNSGEPIAVTPEYIQRKRQALLTKHGQIRQQKNKRQ